MFTSIFEFLPEEIRGFAPYGVAILLAGILLGLGVLIARLRSKKSAPLIELFDAIREELGANKKSSRFKAKAGGFSELRFGGLTSLPDSATLASIVAKLPHPKVKEGAYLIDYDDLSENELTIVWHAKAPLLAATETASRRFYKRFEETLGGPRYDRIEILDGLDGQGSATSIALTLQEPLSPQHVKELTLALAEEFGGTWGSEAVSSVVLRLMRADEASPAILNETSEAVLEADDDGNGDLGNMGGLLAEDKDNELIANTDAELEEWLSYDDEDEVDSSADQRVSSLLDDAPNPFREAIAAAEAAKTSATVAVEEEEIEESTSATDILKEAIKLASSRTGVPGSTEDFEVLKLDETSTPREVVVYLDETYKITDPELAAFVRDMIAILNVNFDGAWDYQIFEETGIDQVLFQS